MGKKVGKDKKEDFPVLFRRVYKRKIPYAMGLATFCYFGAIFVVFFGCLIFPSILLGKFYFVSNADIVTWIDHVAFTPVGILLKAFIALTIVILPFKLYRGGYVFSTILLAYVGIIAWHYLAVAVGLEKFAVAVENFNPFLAPFGILDGLLVFIPAYIIAVLVFLTYEAMEGELKEGEKVKIPMDFTLKITILPAFLALALGFAQLTIS
ncbi:MAG: hypothetical protein NZ872_01465 [Archaeoglobaceae archaeon]|nr:hypothetical protein [Archaeoglobaceae archaeon]MDW8127867.1 hypothetical protein [Archaeoglobaceae archaeon]